MQVCLTLKPVFLLSFPSSIGKSPLHIPLILKGYYMLPGLCCPFPGGFYSEIHLSLLLGGCFLLTYDSSFLDHLPPKPLIRESRVGRVLGIVKKDFPPLPIFAFIFNCTSFWQELCLSWLASDIMSHWGDIIRWLPNQVIIFSFSVTHSLQNL